MFTVLICSNAFLKSVREEHSHVLDLLARNPHCEICPWNPEAITLEEAVPGLEKIVEGRAQWRAIIIQDKDTFGFDHINRRNPFDEVDATKLLTDFNEVEVNDLICDYKWIVENSPDGERDKEAEQLKAEATKKIAESAAKIKQHRQLKRSKYVQATETPLTKLAIWLLGSPLKSEPEGKDFWPQDLMNEDAPIDWDYFTRLAGLRVLPGEFEQYKLDCEKYKILNEHFLSGSLLRRKPSEVLVISERNSKRADDIYCNVKVPHEELEYDNFCDDNLYHDDLRFVICDVDFENQRRTPRAFLSFASFIFLTATNEIPNGVMRRHRVYNGTIRIDEAKARKFFTQYLRKLEATKRMLSKLGKRLKTEDKDDETLSAEDAIKLFESDAKVEVQVRSNAQRKDFMGKTNIGLARDCPRDEYDSWYSFAKATTRKFIRYIREPRRAVKHAVSGDFRKLSTIEDERIFLLDEDRLEDIEFRLQEEELRMVETTTTRIFKTKEYTDKMDEADQAVRKGIAKRLTKLKIFLVTIIALLAFMSGFLPLIFKNRKTMEMIGASMKIVGIAAGVMLLVSIVFMLVMRYLQVRRIKHFNATMHDIFDDIENGLAAFSKYLSHACNVMRAFSIFNYLKSSEDSVSDIICKHLYDIQTKIDGISGLFVSILEIEGIGDTMPYNYDFTKLADYVYEIPYEEINNEIEFLQKDNFVSIPIDYVKEIILEREELYD